MPAELQAGTSCPQLLHHHHHDQKQQQQQQQQQRWQLTTSSEAVQTSRNTSDSSHTGLHVCHTTDVCLARESSVGWLGWWGGAGHAQWSRLQ